MTLTPKYSTSCLFCSKAKNAVVDAEEDEAENDIEAKSKEHGEGAAPN
jgi:hypothetical protein